MNDTTIWWVLAGAIVAIELITGTVYLLLISLGLAAGAMAAHLGLPISVQNMGRSGGWRRHCRNLEGLQESATPSGGLINRT